MKVSQYNNHKGYYMQENNQIPNSGNTDGQFIKYLTPEKIWLGLPFINSQGKILHLGFPYLKHECWLADSKIEAVRLLDVWDFQGILYVKVQNLKTMKVSTLLWNLEYTNGRWMWSITDLFTIAEV